MLMNADMVTQRASACTKQAIEGVKRGKKMASLRRFMKAALLSTSLR